MTTLRQQRTIEGEAALAQTLGALEGQWIAVRSFEVVNRAGSLEDLLERVDVDAVDRIFEVKPVAPALPLSPHV